MPFRRTKKNAATPTESPAASEPEAADEPTAAAAPDETSADAPAWGAALSGAPVIDPGRAAHLGEIIPTDLEPAVPLSPRIVAPAASGPNQTCPSCQESAPFDAKFCEACGSDLVLPVGAPGAEATPGATDPCISCGAAPDSIHHGYCDTCGTKQPSPRDHQEVDLGWIGSVTDKGIVHHQNEDASAIAAVEDHAIVVVCDGVSTTERPQDASAIATSHVAEQLRSAVESGADLEGALTDALDAAQVRVASLTHKPGSEPPSCTIVAAVSARKDGEIHTVVAWLGDSRAYWIDAAADDAAAPPSVTLLTEDHSWATDQRHLGTLDDAAIAADPRAHSITRWLGLDSAALTPGVVHHRGAQGRLMLCSDGLWNYAEELDAMAARVSERPGTPTETARALVEFANASGGRDNITVAIADFTVPPAASADSLSDDDQGGSSA